MTYVTDPIGDLLTRIRNAQAARRSSCRAPLSKMKVALCELLKKEGWIQDVKVVGEAPKQSVEVHFVPGRILALRRMSTPGRRLYSKASELKQVLRGYGIAVVTTSEGLMTDAEAKKRKLGGEVLCTISHA